MSIHHHDTDTHTTHTADHAGAAGMAMATWIWALPFIVIAAVLIIALFAWNP